MEINKEDEKYFKKNRSSINFYNDQVLEKENNQDFVPLLINDNNYNTISSSINSKILSDNKETKNKFDSPDHYLNSCNKQFADLEKNESNTDDSNQSNNLIEEKNKKNNENSDEEKEIEEKERRHIWYIVILSLFFGIFAILYIIINLNKIKRKKLIIGIYLGICLVIYSSLTE